MALAPIDLTSIAAGTGGFVLWGREAFDEAGFSAASAGDINGDGFEDLIIGALGGDGAGNAKSLSGESYVVFGTPSGFGSAVDLARVGEGNGGFVIYGQDAGDQSGFSVTSAGDINGDGFADLVIGARNAAGATNTQAYAGAAYVVFGKAFWPDASLDLGTIATGAGGFVIHGREAGDRLGFSVASAGDFNGDGLDDLIIGAVAGDGAGNAFNGAGEAYLVFGRTGGFGAGVDLTQVAAGIGGFVLHGRDTYDSAGQSVASAGDINGDGLDDLIIGAPFAASAGNGRPLAGESYVVFGTTAPMGGAVDLAAIAAGTGGFVILGRDGSDASGSSVASAGDINGDGFGDIIIGAPSGKGATNSASQVGESYVVFGKSGGFGASVDLTTIAAGTGGFVIHGIDASDNMGVSVASAGDVNADGFDDLIIGAHRADAAGNLKSSAGDSYVVFGKSASFGASLDLSTIVAGTGGFVIYGEKAGGEAGRSVASAGDVNGDGFDDLIIGAHIVSRFGASTTAAGDTYVVFGRDFTNTVSRLGTAGVDSLIGTASKNTMVGGQGNDILVGNGGADVLVGGSGDDYLGVGDLTFHRVDGGTGTDIMALGGTGLLLDLTQPIAARLTDLEIIDLTGTGNNTLKVSARAVLNLSSISNTLRIEGNAGDSVNLGGEGWTHVATLRGYATYRLGEATLEVDTDVTVGLPPVYLENVAGGIGGFAIHGRDAGDNLAWSVASAGDVNGDGFDDLIIGAPLARGSGNATTAVGESYVVFGKAGGFGASVDLAAVAAGVGGFVIYGRDQSDLSGWSVASAGDVNGDGFGDLIIGAQLAAAAGNTAPYAGETYVVFGKAGGFGASIDLANVANGTGGFVIHGRASGDSSGYSVASAGDVNGDGFGDLIIGAPRADGAGNATAFSGEVYVVFGKAGGFGASINATDIANGTGGFVIHGRDIGDSAGTSVASAGDVNGDGIGDLIIGVPMGDAAGNTTPQAGETYVVFGRTTGFGASIDLADIANGTGGFVIHGRDAQDRSGLSVAAAGDVNGDGFGDLVIGVPDSGGNANASNDAGEAYVVFGHAGGFPTGINLADIAAGSGGFVIYGRSSGDSFGFSVAAAGDVNGDGLDDLIVGAPVADRAGNATGISYVVLGRVGGFGASVDLSAIEGGTGGFALYGRDSDDFAGVSVASAGDIDGDGFDDLIVGARLGDGPGNATTNAGEAYVVFGGNMTATVTHAGTAASETLTGTAGADIIVAGLGNDTILGGGGGDALLGGGGNDRIGIADLAFRRVDGGSGVDTLALTGGGLTLDLTAVADSRLRDIEIIDLTGTGNNTVALSPLEVLNLSSTTNTLTVDGDAGDAVLLGSPAWIRGATKGGYTLYTAGQASLLIATAVTQVGVAVTRPDLVAASDTGVSDSDNVTRDTTPTFAGMAEAHAEITLLSGATVLGTGKADATGAWSITTGPLADGTHAIRARTSSPVAPDSPAVLVIIDTTLSPPPTAPVMVPGSDGGTSDSDGITRTTRPVFQGIAEAGATVTLHDGATLIGTGRANLAGQWAIRTDALAEGTHVVTAMATDAAGNSAGPSGGASVTVDRSAPNRPTRPDLAAASDSGASDTDNVTNISTPVLAGTAEAEAIVELLVGTTVVGTGKADGTGAWSIATSPLADGTHVVWARATDAAGNQGLASPGQFITIDTTAEPPPFPLKATTTAISGVGPAGTTVRLFAGATAIGSAVVTSAGTWNAPVSLGPGTHSVTATTVDRAGNVSAASVPMSLVLGGPGDDDLLGSAGADVMAGGAGNDIYHVNHVGDVVNEAGGGGTADTILASIDLWLTAITGIEFLAADTGAGALVLAGNAAANRITGGDGDDTLIGAAGADTLTGGAGADTIRYDALSESTVAVAGRDTIIGFAPAEGDRIDLSALDADATLAFDQAFVFVGANPFSGTPAELRAEVAGGWTIVSADTNGDSVADFAIRLQGTPALTAAAFVL